MKIGRKQDDPPVLVLSGTHGSGKGDNWSGRLRRYFRNDNAVEEDAGIVDQLRSQGTLKRPVTIVNIEGITADKFNALLQSKAHIVHAYCFSIADPWVMDFYNLTVVHTLRV